MNALQQQIEQEQARLAQAQSAQAERELAQRQAQQDAQTVAEASKRLRQLQIKAAEQQFNHELATSNVALIDTHNGIIRDLYAKLDAYDLRGALQLYAKLQASYSTQQSHKGNLLSVMRDEPQAYIDAELARRKQEAMAQNDGRYPDQIRYGDENAVFREAAGIQRRRVLQVPNAIRPDAALTQYVGSKPRNSNERQIAAGLCFSLSGMQFDPTDNYSAQADTDTHIHNQYQQQTF